MPSAAAPLANDTDLDFKMAWNHYFAQNAVDADTAQGELRRNSFPQPRPGLGTHRLRTSLHPRGDCHHAKTLLAVDAFSTFIGKVAAWAVVLLTMLISWEVFSRYALNKPHAWVLDAQIMLYGTMFMLASAYTLSKNAMCAAMCSTASSARAQAAGICACTSCSSCRVYWR